MTEVLTGPQMSLVEMFLVAATVALVLARWLPAAARRPAGLGAATGAVVSGAVLVATGPRWHLAPVALVAVLGLVRELVAELRRRGERHGVRHGAPRDRGHGEPPAHRHDAPPARRHHAPPDRRAPRWLALPATAACLALVATGPAAAWALPVPQFPAPTGRHPVGTAVVQWTDPERAEGATADPADRRTVVAQLWCPARGGSERGERARYLGRTRAEARTVARALADYAGVPAFALDGLPDARTHAAPDAPVADGGRFPLVLFSPGLGGVRGQNTAWAEELASHGYVVAALDHPHDSAAVVLADGRTVRTRVAATGDPEVDERRAAGWTAVRAADLGFALTRLTGPGEGAGPLAGRLDADRVAVAGHSLGGAAALQAARQDHRFAAVVNLDGSPHGPGARPYPQPVLALTQEIGPATDPDYLPRLTRALDLGTATGYRLTVPGAAHLTFTDAPLYLPPLPSLTGSRARAEGPRLTAAATLAFLGPALRGDAADAADALSAHGELTVHRPTAR
ncbi:alpha/beta hydrolase family protein [Streptomyces sp. TRM70308]|uniref:alpha/beta hydrolase family protein n=1 Tax=Streptomyces sp. TRM70308 TaxID=3131932 RepID=UPI003D03597E